MQLELLDKIRDELEPRLVECFDAYVSRLETKLCSARIELEALIDDDTSNLSLDNLSFKLSRTKKLHYSAFESHVERIVAELESWQSGFDPSWLFLVCLSSARIDSALTQQIESKPQVAVLDNVRAIRTTLQDIKNNQGGNATVFRDHSFVSASRTPLPSSNLQMSSTSISMQGVIIDTTDYPAETDAADVRRQVRDLARILMHGEPSVLGLLRCLGVLEFAAMPNLSHRYQLIYAIPDSLKRPATLRRLLSEPPTSLDAKFALAKAMSRSVASVHVAGFVHKNIRPETLLVFRGESLQVPTTFLVGFERFRGVYETTTFTGDMVWYRNLYRHPSRQGQQPDERYQMQHDIYSLGVCLLEIGLWDSFVTGDDPPQPGPSLDISAELTMKNERQAASLIKRKLIELANERLPASMGLMYTQVVNSCLTCLDPQASNMFTHDTDLRDEDGILIGVVFIEKIFTRLQSISISG